MIREELNESVEIRISTTEISLRCLRWYFLIFFCAIGVFIIILYFIYCENTTVSIDNTTPVITTTITLTTENTVSFYNTTPVITTTTLTTEKETTGTSKIDLDDIWNPII